MNETLVIDALRAIAERPNGLDRKVLLRLQENLACDVMQANRPALADLLADHGPDAVAMRANRRAIFIDRLNEEYRARAKTTGFSLPLYLETAGNHYRLEVRRHLLQVRDYIAQGRAAAEVLNVKTARELRSVDPGVSDLAQKVAEGMSSINVSLQQLGRIRSHAAEELAQSLQADLQIGLNQADADTFAASLLREAQSLTDARDALAEIADDKVGLRPH